MSEQDFIPRVLVVDDEPGIVRLCTRLLEKAGFAVLACGHPQDAIALLESGQQVHLLLADIRMPGMDGFQLLELARRKQPDLAVVVMTGFGTVETAIEALSRGANGLVLKPFSGAELVQIIRRALEENQHKQDVLRLQTLRPLFTITEALFTETNPARLQSRLVDAVCGHLKCQEAGIYWRDPGQNIFKLQASRGSLLEAEEVLPENPVARAESWRTALLVNRDGLGDPALQSALRVRGYRSFLAAPLWFRESTVECCAVLVAARSMNEDVFRESDLETFAILARQAAVALENARLHDELHAYIRQLEESQRALVQAEKVAIAGRMTASIAHEINNPLQSVQNCLHLAGRRELSSSDRQEYLEMAETELDRLMQIVQRMLDYFRPGVIDRKTVDFNSLLERVLKLLEKQIENRRVIVRTSLEASLPPVLIVKDQIQQVLLNLVLNALEAMPVGGTLRVETAARNLRIECTIEDSGPGVPVDRRRTIFEPFVSSKEGGTGLGLAVSYGIIAAHGGSLDLVSGQGTGACFLISLPYGES
jgi:two-component system, NtrC family, sensor kinase